MVKSPLKQKVLGASILGCGVNKIWIDPSYKSDITAAKSRRAVKKLISTGLIVRKRDNAVSRARWAAYKAAKLLGRHRGLGNRKGSAESRNPVKWRWIQRLRVLRRLAKKCRDTGKIDHHHYHKLYLAIKGNQFKNKRVLLESIIKMKNQKRRAVAGAAHIQMRKDKAEGIRQKKAAVTQSLVDLANSVL